VKKKLKQAAYNEYVCLRGKMITSSYLTMYPIYVDTRKEKKIKIDLVDCHQAGETKINCN